MVLQLMNSQLRVNSATGATASTDKKIGSINLTMDGTVTSYNTVNGTIAK